MLGPFYGLSWVSFVGKQRFYDGPTDGWIDPLVNRDGRKKKYKQLINTNQVTEKMRVSELGSFKAIWSANRAIAE